MENLDTKKEYILNKNGLKIKVTANKPSDETLYKFANKCKDLYDKIEHRKKGSVA